MPEEQDDDKEFDLELIDLGDAAAETKQQFPQGIHADCLYTFGTRPGCWLEAS